MPLLTDVIGVWRLRKSISLQDARYHVNHGEHEHEHAKKLIQAARYSSREIVKAKIRARRLAELPIYTEG